MKAVSRFVVRPIRDNEEFVHNGLVLPRNMAIQHNVYENGVVRGIVIASPDPDVLPGDELTFDYHCIPTMKDAPKDNLMDEEEDLWAIIPESVYFVTHEGEMRGYNNRIMIEQIFESNEKVVTTPNGPVTLLTTTEPEQVASRSRVMRDGFGLKRGDIIWHMPGADIPIKKDGDWYIDKADIFAVNDLEVLEHYALVKVDGIVVDGAFREDAYMKNGLVVFTKKNNGGRTGTVYKSGPDSDVKPGDRVMIDYSVQGVKIGEDHYKLCRNINGVDTFFVWEN